MGYRVLIPVTAAPEMVAPLLASIPDHTKLVLVNNYTNPEVALLCRRAHDAGAEVYHFPENLGVAASWNIGLAKLTEPDVDLVCVLSASVIFRQPFEAFIDMVRAAEEEKACSVHLTPGLAYHCATYTKLGLKLGGYYDENFWPAYVEDVDYLRRSALNGVQETVNILSHVGLDHIDRHGVGMTGKTLPAFQALLTANQGRYGEYYVRKWGAWTGCRAPQTPHYLTPFNDPTKGVNDWSVDCTFNNVWANNPNWTRPAKPYVTIT